MADEPALALRFVVTIDGHESLGEWTRCEGLGGEVEVLDYRPGGENGGMLRAPGRARWSNVKLTRPLRRSPTAIWDWLHRVAGSGRSGGAKTSVDISIRDAAGEEVAAFVLTGAFPVRYTAPVLDVAEAKTAVEVLELAYWGARPRPPRS
jgi:phage tail-like protein